MTDLLQVYVDTGDGGASDNQKSSPARQLRDVINDAFSFIRSCEANQAFATVTLEQLMNDQIARNGESGDSFSSKYDPYTYDPDKATPASGTATAPASNISGADTARPTKYDRITAIVNNIEAVVQAIKNTPPVAVADTSDYTLQTQVSLPTQDEELK